MCRDCSGSAFCEHGRQEQQCQDCDGVSICEHGHIKYTCKKCPANVATGLCEHRVLRSSCSQGCGLRAESAAFLGLDATELDLTDAGCAERKRKREEQEQEEEEEARAVGVPVVAPPMPVAVPLTVLQVARARLSARSTLHDFGSYRSLDRARAREDFARKIELRRLATAAQMANKG
jgi:hypothetical protein